MPCAISYNIVKFPCAQGTNGQMFTILGNFYDIVNLDRILSFAISTFVRNGKMFILFGEF